MDDYDSFSTVVSAPKGDDYDSFSSVVDTPKAATKKSVLDRVSDAIDEGKKNLSKEVSNPLSAAKNLALGIGKGAFDVVDGGAQLLSRGIDAAANKVAPGSALQKWTQANLKNVESINDDREAKYQKATEGSVLAGAGRVAGNAVLPVGNAARLERGASLISKAGNSAVGGATVGALQPVYNAGDDFAKDKAIQVAGGAALGAAAPVVAKVGLEAASKLGSKKAEQYLTDTRKAQLFDKSAAPKEDAELITELGGIKERVGDRKLITNDINARSVKNFSDANAALEAAGGTPAEMLAMKNWQGLTKSEQDAMRGTPKGDAIAAIMTKLDRVRALTPGALSNNLLSVPRVAADMLPGGPAVRFTLKNLLGGRITRNEDAAKLLDPRSQRAAAQFTEANGPSDATTGLQTLQDMGKTRQDAADYDLVQRAIDKRNAKELADSMANGSRSPTLSIAEKQAAKSKQAMADQISRDPSLIVDQARDPRQFGKTAAALKQDIEDRARDALNASKAKSTAQDAADTQALQIKARKISGTPGGGAYQALIQHTGLASDDLNKVLRVAQKIPEAAAEIKKIRVDGANTKEGAIYPITDIVKKIASDMGLGEGALTQSASPGALTAATGGLERVSPAYQMGTKVRQNIYDKLINKASDLPPGPARDAAVKVGQKLKPTPKSTERNSMIDDLEAAHPETKGLFDQVRNFKP